MRKPLIAGLVLALSAPVAAPALADPPPHAKAWGKRAKDRDRERDRWERDRWEQQRYGQQRNWSRPERYYVSNNNYRPYRLNSDDRVYRGRDGRYYCRRKDGTTGLIIGALGGGALGNLIAPGGSKTVGTLAGGALGALLGKSLDDGVTCR